ncbi:hypothetical protein AB1286_09310 [Trinickia sp. NRRL B-1857]|uniref:hypothetical protein n=1 Tax=Trinickia sp. NRRL B-1857 TaxID=3162879 RepID=UPI003D26EA57
MFIVNLKTLFQTLVRAPIQRRWRDAFSGFRPGVASTIEEMSRDELVAYARQVDVELARLTAQHVKPLARAFRLAKVSGHHRELGVTTAFDESGFESDGYERAFHIAFEIAEHAPRRARADRLVERQLARRYPEAAAALVALRRYVLRDALDWPHAARLDYERNILADTLELTPRHLRHERMEYWASLLDVFPNHEFDIADKAPNYYVDDGATVFEEGRTVGRKGDLSSERDSRYAPGTFLHAKWIDGYRIGKRQVAVERRGAGRP